MEIRARRSHGNRLDRGSDAKRAWTVLTPLAVLARASVERLCAAAGLIVLAPVFLPIALAIKLDSRGPVIFRQYRIGRHGRPFTIYKFRTLHAESDAYAEKPARDALHITRVGRFLRDRGLDELPQLFCVLVGNMSFIGPRPEMPFIVASYDHDEQLRLSVKPGITGYWQVAAPRTAPMRTQLQYDLHYIDRRSLALDLWILIRTAAIACGMPLAPRLQPSDDTPRPRRIRIAEILEATSGGALTHIDLLLRHIDRSKFDVTFICALRRDSDIVRRLPEYRRAGITVEVVDMVRQIAPLRDFRSAWRLYRYVRRHRFDVVHTHSSKAGIVGRLAARLGGVPLILHTPHGFAFQDDRYPALQRAYAGIERIAGRWTDLLVCVSKDERGLALDHRIVTPNRACVVYNSIPFEAADEFPVADVTLRTHLNLNDASFVIGTVANLRPEKGLQDFVTAARLMLDERPDLKFLIVGSGELEGELSRQIARERLSDHVTIARSNDVIWKYLALMDVFVSTSLREGLPYAILEAMAMRRPIVATAVTGSRELIVTGSTGTTVPPRDARRLAREALDLLSAPDARARYGAAARALVERRHGIQRGIAHLESIYAAAAIRASEVRRFEADEHEGPATASRQPVLASDREAAEGLALAASRE